MPSPQQRAQKYTSKKRFVSSTDTAFAKKVSIQRSRILSSVMLVSFACMMICGSFSNSTLFTTRSSGR